MNFSSRLKQLRTNQMLSISKLAKRSGLSQSFVCRIESGEKQPTLESLYKLAHGLGVGVGELLGEEVMNEPDSPIMQRLQRNIRSLSSDQLEALDLFLASISKGSSTGETPLSLQEIQYHPNDSEELEIKLVFSSNVSAVMEHRIPGGTERNMSCFQLFDAEKNQIPIELIPGNQRAFGRNAEKAFIIKPLLSLKSNQLYILHISRLLQANNYRYLHQNHTISFTTNEIVNLTPHNRKLLIPHLSLTLENSSLASGSENVPVNASLRLTFSNDVCAQAIREHNRSCFSLQTSKNKPVEIDIIMAEAADHPYRKKEIVIQPRYGLEQNSAYILIISERLKDINQKQLSTDKMISFTTGNEETNSQTEKNDQSIA